VELDLQCSGDVTSAPSLLLCTGYDWGEMGGACCTQGDITYTYIVVLRERQGKRLHERPGRRSEDDIKMNFKEIEYGDVYCTCLVQDSAVANTVMNLQPLNKDPVPSCVFVCLLVGGDLIFYFDIESISI
jgi:hypothetical protein